MRATRQSIRNAKLLRRAMSPPEVRLWALLRQSPAGIKFRRQHPIGPYVADFYCAAAKLVIEVDGAIHDWSGEGDCRGDEYMSDLGLQIIRIPAGEVMRDVHEVADLIVQRCGPSTAQRR